MIELIQRISEFLAKYKGLPVLVGAGLVLLNFLLRLVPPFPVVGWLAEYDLFLHLGIVVGLIGILVGDAL
jgi:hypothetical protein